MPRFLLLLVCGLALPLFAAQAATDTKPPVLQIAPGEIDTLAREAYVIDFDTGAVLLAKNAEERMATASMSKVMTMYLVFEALKNGHWTLEEDLPVSQKAWSMQGSKMFVDINARVKIEDLIRGVIVQSGNDATIVLAEGLSGNEEAFAAAMNAKAKELGMVNSNFMNASGWPDPQHYSTAKDLGILAKALIKNFPEYYHYYSEIDFTYHGIKQGNRNPLLYKNIGGDGIKTGHTQEAGYGLIGTGKQDGRRVFLVVNGLKNMQERADESARLLEWGLKRFENRPIFKAGQEVETVPVAFGATRRVQIGAQSDFIMTVPRGGKPNVKITAQYKEPLIAPIVKGQDIGTLKLEDDKGTVQTIPLVALADVPRLPFFALTLAKVQAALFGAY
jgi:D-alanyl-D-alanine carboxypeptidase (penicillin-binding protein 5/6)